MILFVPPYTEKDRGRKYLTDTRNIQKVSLQLPLFCAIINRMAKVTTRVSQKVPKPFLKWVGGKGRLLDQLLPLFPKTFEAYYEPFFGGGAVFFALAPVTGQINDVNKALMSAYVNVRDDVEEVIDGLRKIENEYISLDKDKRQDYYYKRREEYNNEEPTSLSKTVLLIFLNKTCFNGLYRENRKGGFNVPHGSYANPTICDETTLRCTSKALRYVKVTSGPFADAVKDAKDGDFVYFDPPYYPINPTSSFTSYSIDDFLDDDQRQLKTVIDDLTRRGVKVALSNSDTPFIRDLYKDYRQEFVMAGRAINSVGSKRGKVSEIVVLNY